jgi:YjbE family integral membrane protein
VLTIVAVELLRLPYLKFVGAVLLLWIAVQLLLPEEGGEGKAEVNTSMAGAIKTILIADLVMSLDNVIAVAAAAKGSVTLLVIGLAISIPLVVFASQILLKLMERFPIIITLGAALLGWVAGEMAITDPVAKDWIDAHAHWLHYVAPALGAAGVVVVGTWLARRAEKQVEAVEVAAQPKPAAHPARVAGRIDRILLPVDGSEGSMAAVREALSIRSQHPQPQAVEFHVVNVQRHLPGDAARFVSQEALDAYRRERAEDATAPALAMLQTAGVRPEVHQLVGDPGRLIADLARSLDCDQIVMGARGLGSFTGGLLGSVTQGTLEHSTVPVLVVKQAV